MSKKKEKTITVLLDGAVIRLHNRRIVIVVEGEKVTMQFDKPNEKTRGVQRVAIAITKEAMDGIAKAIDLLKNEKIL